MSNDTALHTQNSKFGPWRSEAEHATSRSRKLPKNTDFFTNGWGRNIFVSFKPPIYQYQWNLNFLETCFKKYTILPELFFTIILHSFF